ncbi:hypothetical protein G3480_23665 [Thiorhodococcus mannitoliphagus]|uniref:Uncharacterized protein n=1 Tax=Thiorhodococcus mannitoliphagus TaxID=329406 RepID=A0A6P1DYG7_9GAMM|nr:hypothetical protein [Thiorhodococcus mannitoliphagus]NEX23258.1 hypothetical protein [Thiorhodococcus mannitoliphagus]
MTKGAFSGHDSKDRADALRLTRRELLALTLAAGLLRGLPQTASAAQTATEPLLDVVSNRAAAAVLGRAYLVAHPEEADLARLRTLLQERLRTDVSDEASILVRIERQLRNDYIRGDLVEVDGWLLSLTEARLYALAALARAG